MCVCVLAYVVMLVCILLFMFSRVREVWPRTWSAWACHEIRSGFSMSSILGHTADEEILGWWRNWASAMAHVTSRFCFLAVIVFPVFTSDGSLPLWLFTPFLIQRVHCHRNFSHPSNSNVFQNVMFLWILVCHPGFYACVWRVSSSINGWSRCLGWLLGRYAHRLSQSSCQKWWPYVKHRLHFVWYLGW